MMLPSSVFVVTRLEAVPQNLLVRPTKDPVAAFDACILECGHAKVAEPCLHGSDWPEERRSPMRTPAEARGQS